MSHGGQSGRERRGRRERWTECDQGIMSLDPRGLDPPLDLSFSGRRSRLLATLRRPLDAHPFLHAATNVRSNHPFPHSADNNSLLVDALEPQWRGACICSSKNASVRPCPAFARERLDRISHLLGSSLACPTATAGLYHRHAPDLTSPPLWLPSQDSYRHSPITDHSHSRPPKKLHRPWLSSIVRVRK